MGTVAEIKAAIPSLTLAERAEVAGCLKQWQYDEWDEQMKRDLATRILDPMLSQVDDDIARAKLLDLP
jgi:hypothetical protein